MRRLGLAVLVWSVCGAPLLAQGPWVVPANTNGKVRVRSTAIDAVCVGQVTSSSSPTFCTGGIMAGGLIIPSQLVPVFIGTTANTKQEVGLTINGAGTEKPALAFKNTSTVAHGMTALEDTDTYAVFGVSAAGGAFADGGLRLRGFTETSVGLDLRAAVTTVNAVKSAAGLGAVMLTGEMKVGTTVGAITANSNVLAVTDGAFTRFIVDADGDTFQDGTAGTAYSAYDDPMLALAWEHEFAPSSLLGTLQQTYGKYDKAALIAAGIVAPDDEHGNRGFVNTSALLRLAVGASWQLGVEQRRVTAELDALKTENLALAHRLAVMEAALAQVPDLRRAAR